MKTFYRASETTANTATTAVNAAWLFIAKNWHVQSSSASFFFFFKTFLGEAGPGDAVAHVVSRKEVLKTKFYILTPFSPIPGNLGQILT